MSETDRKPSEMRPEPRKEPRDNNQQERELREGQYVMQWPIPEPRKPRKRRPSSQPKPKD